VSHGAGLSAGPVLANAGFYRKSTAKDQSALRLRIREIAHARPRFGYQRIHVMLRREGWPVNKKRVRRLYRLDGLQLRMRIRRRKHMCLHRGPVPCRGPARALEHGLRARPAVRWAAVSDPDGGRSVESRESAD
jgi:transposase InsO family protein